jgi:hypothetical protein
MKYYHKTRFTYNCGVQIWEPSSTQNPAASGRRPTHSLIKENPPLTVPCNIRNIEHKQTVRQTRDRTRQLLVRGRLTGGTLTKDHSLI